MSVSVGNKGPSNIRVLDDSLRNRSTFLSVSDSRKGSQLADAPRDKQAWPSSTRGPRLENSPGRTAFFLLSRNQHHCPSFPVRRKTLTKLTVSTAGDVREKGWATCSEQLTAETTTPTALLYGVFSTLSFGAWGGILPQAGRCCQPCSKTPGNGNDSAPRSRSRQAASRYPMEVRPHHPGTQTKPSQTQQQGMNKLKTL